MNLRPVVGAIILALAAPVAMAAVTPPAANVLPGAYNSNNATTYASTGTDAAKITVPSGATVLQFGGSSAGVATTVAAPKGITTAAGFNIGSAASLTVESNAAAGLPVASVLINDITGNPSQVYGTLQAVSSATADGPTLFVANANGVIVGNSATITLPNGGGFIGEAQNPANFTSGGGAGTVQTGTGNGVVSIMSGASISNNGYLLVAGNGNVNVGDATVTGTGSAVIMAGYGFTQTANIAATTVAGALPTSTATVNFSGGVSGTAAKPTATVYAAGNVNVRGGSYVDLTNATISGLGGSFTNNGTATLGQSLAPTAAFTNNGLLDAVAHAVNAGTSFTNNGTITSIGAVTATGAFTNNGTVKTGGTVSAASITNAGSFTANGLTFTAASTGGIVNSGTLSASGGSVALDATSTSGTLISNTGTITNSGNFGATAASGNFTNTGTLNYSAAGSNLTVSATKGSVTLGGNVQIGSSALSATNTLGTVSLSAGSTGTLQLGTMLFAGSSGTMSGGAVTVTSGGVNVSGGNTLTVDVGSGYNLGLYSGTQLTASTVDVSGSGANLILAGTLGGTNASTINVTAANIYAGAHTAGGFSLSPSGALNLTFSGNIVNQNGVTSPVLNYAKAMPVNANGGYVTVNLDPTNAGTAKQYVNLGVNGSAILTSSLTSPVTIPNANGSIVSNYPWGGLTVQATGNLQAGGSKTTGTGSFYYPGQMFFATVNGLGGTFGLSKSGTIDISGQLSNAVTSKLTGMGGMAFLSNNALVFGNGSAKGIDAKVLHTGNVLTNTNAWLNFPASGSLATGYNALNAQNKYFYGLVYANGTFTPTLAGGNSTTNKFNSVTLP
jgi:hypothetical protein